MIQEPRCTERNCKHYLGVSGGSDEKDQRPICEAYKKAIPDDISYGRSLHLVVRADQDNEIIFERGKDIFERD